MKARRYFATPTRVTGEMLWFWNPPTQLVLLNSKKKTMELPPIAATRLRRARKSGYRTSQASYAASSEEGNHSPRLTESSLSAFNPGVSRCGAMPTWRGEDCYYL